MFRKFQFVDMFAKQNKALFDLNEGGNIKSLKSVVALEFLGEHFTAGIRMLRLWQLTKTANLLKYTCGVQLLLENVSITT